MEKVMVTITTDTPIRINVTRDSGEPCGTAQLLMAVKNAEGQKVGVRLKGGGRHKVDG